MVAKDARSVAGQGDLGLIVTHDLDAANGCS
jgi:hypothetical protein